MSELIEAFLSTAEVAVGLLSDPSVAEAWEAPSALDKLTVGALADHLASQILLIQRVLGEPAPSEPVASLLDHYARAAWVGADLDAEINVGIRTNSAATASIGAHALAAKTATAVDELRTGLVAPPNHPIHLGHWDGYSLSLDDFLTTRLMELVVHSDDLAVSVNVATPTLPLSAVDIVVELLSKIAVRRHGATNVLRALSRAERAPDRITAF
jgi:hypothetical protein